jgi:hypothetical protein
MSRISDQKWVLQRDAKELLACPFWSTMRKTPTVGMP